MPRQQIIPEYDEVFDAIMFVADLDDDGNYILRADQNIDSVLGKCEQWPPIAALGLADFLLSKDVDLSQHRQCLLDLVTKALDSIHSSSVNSLIMTLPCRKRIEEHRLELKAAILILGKEIEAITA